MGHATGDTPNRQHQNERGRDRKRFSDRGRIFHPTLLTETSALLNTFPSGNGLAESASSFWSACMFSPLIPTVAEAAMVGRPAFSPLKGRRRRERRISGD